jgi:hypothetical protein
LLLKVTDGIVRVAASLKVEAQILGYRGVGPAAAMDSLLCKITLHFECNDARHHHNNNNSVRVRVKEKQFSPGQSERKNHMRECTKNVFDSHTGYDTYYLWRVQYGIIYRKSLTYLN